MLLLKKMHLFKYKDSILCIDTKSIGKGEKMEDRE
jgi:hypothetical protein